MAKKAAPSGKDSGISEDLLEKLKAAIADSGPLPSDMPEPVAEEAAEEASSESSYDDDDTDADDTSEPRETDATDAADFDADSLDAGSDPSGDSDDGYFETGGTDTIGAPEFDAGSFGVASISDSDPVRDADVGGTSDDDGWFDFDADEDSGPAASYGKSDVEKHLRESAKRDAGHDADSPKADIPKADHSDIVHDAVKHVGRGTDDVIIGGDTSDVVKAKKGDDDVSGGGGDDWLRGGHGDDVLDGGTGSDIVDGGKGDDTLKFTMGEHGDNLDFYDGGKGTDTLEISLTAEEYAEYADELDALADWVAENADSKNSTGHGFGDVSSHSAKHPIFETSFGLVVRNIEDVNITIVDSDPGPVVEPDLPVVPEPEPEPELPVEAEPAEGSVVIDLETTVVDPEAPSIEPVTTVAAPDSPISVEAITATLGPDSTINVSVDVEVKALPPQFDVFLVQDLSGSFWDDLPNVKSQFPILHDTLSAEYDVAFGVGSFVDKPTGTFGWTGDYVYRTDLAMTTDGEAVAEVMNGLTTLSGYDYPEAQLEALAQSALRDDEIGFRDGSQKFVVINTDAAFHKAGDYAIAGPNDMDTDLEDEDYPDPMAVGALLKEAGITPIFAVTSYVVPIYEQLVADWGFGEVVTISSDSSDLTDAIMSGLYSAVQTLSVDVVGDDFGYVSHISPESYEDAGPGTYTFDLTLEIPEGDAAFAADSFAIEIAGYGKVNVEIDIASVDAVGDSYDDTLSGNSEVNALYGMDGNDTLDGRAGNDTLDGGLGADTLTGGTGNDLFVFADGSGTDRITDFEAGDVLDLRRVSSVSSYSDVMIAAHQVGSDVVIEFGDGDSISLLGVEMASLLEENVLL